MKRPLLFAAALLLGLTSVGCVTRRVLITSEPSGAIVYRNGQPIGATPVEEPFVYYGKYHYRLVRDGCDPVDFYPDLVAPWYQWPGVDFVTENFVPWPFRDVQVLHFQLPPMKQVPHAQIRERATELQERAKTIQRPDFAAPLPPKNVPQAPPPMLPVPTPVTSGGPSQGSP